MEEMMRITRLPYDTPKDEAKTSAILIGRGVLAFLLPIVFPKYLLAKFLGPNNPIIMVLIMILGVVSIAGGYMILAGTGLGLHAIYRLTRLKEKWGFAWISLIALPLTLMILALWFMGIIYKGP